MIDPELVATTFRSCLADEATTASIEVEGIRRPAILDADRLEAARALVVEWIEALPDAYRFDEGFAPGVHGGGWSFLNLCMDRDGRQWTGLHLRMEQLTQLAMGLGLAVWIFGRDLWEALPGGMPYVGFTTRANTHRSPLVAS